jgi:carboxyl-terminal processing protease
MRRMVAAHVLTLAVVALPALGADARPPAPPTEGERLLGLARLWKEADYSFVFFDHVPELDWDAAFAAYAPQVREAKDTFAYYRLLQRFAALLKDGHTGVQFPRELTLSRFVDVPPVWLEAVGTRALVTDVEAGLEARLPIGAEVLAVDGATVEHKLRDDVFPWLCVSTDHVRWASGIEGRPDQGLGLLAGPPGTSVTLRVRTPAGEERDVALTRDAANREVVRAQGARPPAPPFELRWLAPDVAYVALNTFGEESVPGAFEAALPELARARGLVVDVRLNGGGSTGNAARVARHLLSAPAAGSSWRTREHRGAHQAWGQLAEPGRGADPYRAYAEGRQWFHGEHDTLEPAAETEGRLVVPTVVLTSWKTGSAAEDFLVYLDRVPHVTRVGGRTYGSTGQPLRVPLPGGFTAWICAKRDTFPDGRDFVGVGILPKVEVAPSIDDVRAGRDPVLDRGLAVLREAMGATPAPRRASLSWTRGASSRGARVEPPASPAGPTRVVAGRRGGLVRGKVGAPLRGDEAHARDAVGALGREPE